MMTAGFFLRVSLSALMIVVASGHPAKGSKSTQQSSSGSSGPSGGFAYRGGAGRRLTPGASGGVSMPVLVQNPTPSQFVVVQADPALSRLSSTYPVGYTGASGSLVSVPAGASGSLVSVPAGASGTVLPVQGGNMVYSPVGYVGSPQAGSAQPGLPETSWAVDPQLVPAEEGSFDSQASGSGDFLYPAPQLPSGPVLQSGETSSVVKEAELGNYQQQSEEFGYPADPLLSGQALGSLMVPASGPGGYWGYPYPDFDYRLLYGLYPPGTYSTFSQHHEKGKDYHQSIHYLKEHEDGGQGQVQQKKVFQGAF